MDIHAESQSGAAHKVFAVVSVNSEKAQDVATQFAAQGYSVQTIWYENSRQLLTQAHHPDFAAVILFPWQSEADTDSEEAELREAMLDTPLFRVA
ncbi:MAG: hypothetical protein H7Y06_07125 [Opitutaceae bacterium]|nr:hypothetical protein [Opitutaceae bacterium]